MSTDVTNRSQVTEVPIVPAQADPSITGRSAADGSTTDESPFKSSSLERLDEALTMASRETGIEFSVYVGHLEGDSRETAERLHSQVAHPANSVVLAVDPGQRVLEIVTGRESAKRLLNRSCALAALSMTAAFGSGNLVGGIVDGLRMLSDQAGHPRRIS